MVPNFLTLTQLFTYNEACVIKLGCIYVLKINIFTFVVTYETCDSKNIYLCSYFWPNASKNTLVVFLIAIYFSNDKRK